MPTVLVVNDLISAHVASLHLRGLRPSTIAKRQWHLERLQAHLAPLPLRDATRDHLELFLARPITSKSRTTEISHYRAFWRWGIERGFLAHDATAGIASPKVRTYIPRPIPEDDVEFALRAARGRVRVWLVLAGWCGLRACEVAQLRGEDIDLTEMLLTVREGKGGSPGVVPLPQFVADEMTAGGLLRDGWCWPKPTSPDRHIAASRVSSESNTFLRAIGVEHTFHAWRHRYATQLYRETRDLRLVQTVMRHRSPEHTAIYTALAPGAERDAVDRLPLPGRIDTAR